MEQTDRQTDSVNIFDEEIESETIDDKSIVEDLEDLEVEGKPFRFFNQKVLLTYKTHIDKNSFVKWLCEVRKWEPKRIYIAHESADPINKYEHTHITIDFGRARDSKSSRCLDFEGIHPNIKKLKTLHDWRRACNYLLKEDKNVVLNKEDKMTQTDVVWACKNIGEVYERIPLNLALAAKEVYKHKPRSHDPPELSEDKFYPWQKKMTEMLFQPPNSRKIYWIFDKEGNKGKTWYCEWINKTHPNKTIYLNNVGQIRDFCQNLKIYHEQMWEGDTMILNFTRNFHDKTHIYQACEMTLDKFITCTKYEGGGFWLKKMHVVIFANFTPKVEEMSHDRWSIFEINKDNDIEYRPWYMYKEDKD